MLDPDLMGEVAKRAGVKPPSITFSIPVDHPAAESLKELMNILATDIKVGELVSRRPGGVGSLDIMLDALRKAGYHKHVDTFMQQLARYEQSKSAISKGMGIMDALIASKFAGDAAKRAQEHIHKQED